MPDYNQKLNTKTKDNSKFAGIQGSIIGKDFLETLWFGLNI
jgi:hypothetical protein